GEPIHRVGNYVSDFIWGSKKKPAAPAAAASTAGSGQFIPALQDKMNDVYDKASGTTVNPRTGQRGAPAAPVPLTGTRFGRMVAASGNRYGGFTTGGAAPPPGAFAGPPGGATGTWGGATGTWDQGIPPGLAQLAPASGGGFVPPRRPGMDPAAYPT